MDKTSLISNYNEDNYIAGHDFLIQGEIYVVCLGERNVPSLVSQK